MDDPKNTFRECPRCYARVSADRMDHHIDWHRHVSDGFHRFVETSWHGSDGVPQCGHLERGAYGDGLYCMLPADHRYHQPLPEATP